MAVYNGGETNGHTAKQKHYKYPKVQNKSDNLFWLADWRISYSNLAEIAVQAQTDCRQVAEDDAIETNGQLFARHGAIQKAP